MSSSSSGGGSGGGASQSGSAASTSPSSSSLSQRRSSVGRAKSDLRLNVGTHLKATAGGRPGVSVHDAPHSPIDLPDKEVTEQPADEQQQTQQSDQQPPDADKGKQLAPTAATKPLPSLPTSSPTSSTQASASPSALATAPTNHPLLALQMMQGQVPPISSGFPSFAYANPQLVPSAPASSPTHAPLQPPPGLPSPHSVAPPALSTFIPVTPSSSVQFLSSGFSTPSSVSSASSSASTSPLSPPPSDPRSIALRYLPTGMQLDGLHALCSPYGAITAIRLKRDQNTGMALGYGFVHYENKEDAERAAEALDGRALGNKLIRVQIAKSPRGAAAGQQWSASAAATGARGAVVISGVPRIWTSAQLQTVGSVYGQVTEVALLEDGKSSNDPSSRSAVLRYAEPTSAVACVAALNGTVPAGAQEPLSVRLSSSPERSGAGFSTPSTSTHSTPGSAQRSRRSSAVAGLSNNDPHSLANQSTTFFNPSFDPAAAAGHQGHVQQIPGGYAVFPASFAPDLMQALPNTVFPSAEPFAQSQSSASSSPPTGSPFANDYYAQPSHMPYFASTQSHTLPSPLSSGASTPTASAPPNFLHAYHDPNLYEGYPGHIMQQHLLAAQQQQQQQQQQRAAMQPHLYHQHAVAAAAAAAAAGRNQLLLQQMQAEDARAQQQQHAQHYPQHPALLLASHHPLLLSHQPQHTHPHLPPLVPYAAHLPPHSHHHSGMLPSRAGGGPIERPGICLFVFHLPPELSDPELLSIFSPFGAVLSCKIITNPHSGQSKGYGFVNYATMEGAKAAIAALNGFKLGSKFLKVQFKKKRDE